LGVAVLFGAAFAGAGFVVEKRAFSFFKHLAGLGDLFSFGSEDDAVDVAFGVGLAEGHLAKVAEADLEVVGHETGGADVEGAVVVGLEDEEEVELDGGAVFGEDELEGSVESEGIGRGFALGQSGFDDSVVAAEIGSGDGWAFAVASFVKDVTAEFLQSGIPLPGVMFTYVIETKRSGNGVNVVS
jgi:hypothetical protein